MSLNKLIFHLYFLPHNIYNFNDSLFGEYFIGKNTKLYLPCSLNYKKETLLFLKNFFTFLRLTYSLHWLRVTFRGKGYRLRKFKKLSKITCNFGHSHWTRIVLNSNEFFFKKLRRQNYLCIIKHFITKKYFKKTIKSVRPLNIYTKRGLRLRRDLIRRRFGKISQVVSSLH